MVKILKSEETGMDDREQSIKEQLQQIAILEMQKGIDEDEMLDMTLKAIEIASISEMAQEKENLEAKVEQLMQKKAELDAIAE